MNVTLNGRRVYGYKKAVVITCMVVFSPLILVGYLGSMLAAGCATCLTCDCM